MKIELTHARALAHDLLNVENTPVPAPTFSDGSMMDIHHALEKALLIYSDNLSLFSHTARWMADSALVDIDRIESTEDHFAHVLDGLT